jgi:hypothetical protein
MKIAVDVLNALNVMKDNSDFWNGVSEFLLLEFIIG